MIHLLVTTMNDNIKSTLEKFSTYVQEGVQVHIAHQITDGSQPMKIDLPGVFYYPSTTRGLSRNRNILLDAVHDGIGVICDDDVYLSPHWLELIRKTTSVYPRAAAWTTQTRTPAGRLRKRYAKAAFRHTKLTILSVSSIEMILDMKKVHAHERRFDEDRGLGTDRPGGEEQLFLADILDDKQYAVYIPLSLAIHPREDSNTGKPGWHKIELMEEMFGRGVGTILGVVLMGKLYLQYFLRPLLESDNIQ